MGASIVQSEVELWIPSVSLKRMKIRRMSIYLLSEWEQERQRMQKKNHITEREQMQKKMHQMKQNKPESDTVRTHSSRKEYNTNSTLSAQMKTPRGRLCGIEWLLIIRKTYSTAHYKKKENSEMEKNYSAADEREQKTHTADDRATEEEHCCDYLWAPHWHTQHTQMEQRENMNTQLQDECNMMMEDAYVLQENCIECTHTHTHTHTLSAVQK